MIMRGGMSEGSRAWRRALVSGLAAAALALTVGAGLYGGARDAEAHMLEPAGVEPQAGARVVQRGGVERRGQEPGPAVREVEQAPESMVFFEPVTGAPAVVTEARMRSITREQLQRADAEGADHFDGGDSQNFLTLPTITVANMSTKAIREVGVGFETGGRVNVVAGYAAKMRPGESQTFGSDWRGRNVIMPGSFADVKVRVVWVAFEDGTQWGGRVHPPRPPAPPLPDPAAPPLPAAEAEPEGSGSNVTVRAGAAGRGGGTAVAVEAGAGSGSGMGASAGGGSGVSVGAGAGAGSGSGGRTSASGGGRGATLADRKIYSPELVYPAIAKAASAEGTVGVRVTVDENGNVVAAEAVSGHPLLQAAAVRAARDSKFDPAVVEGKPVKASGVISFTFALK